VNNIEINPNEVKAQPPKTETNQKVGIVIVSHNASLAVRITLASVRAAKNETPFDLILIDNASQEDERREIKKAFDHHRSEIGAAWRYIQLDENKGFAGGNNIGIKEFLEDEIISHICLLNSDVVVTNYWLDRLIYKNFDITSPVTNRSESTQIVPVDYSIDLMNCLNVDQEIIKSNPYKIVENFSERRHRAWLGNSISVDHVTFFCAMITREIINKVGLLDENFFPGAYEDNDYCKRVKNINGEIGLIRDDYIHHWGSASFGQLPRDYFNEHAIKNRQYFEKKHNTKWKPQPENPFISFKFDAMHGIKGNGNHAAQKDLVKLYENELSKIINQNFNDFSELRSTIFLGKYDVPLETKKKIIKIDERSIKRQFNELFSLIYEYIGKDTASSSEINSVKIKFEFLIEMFRLMNSGIIEMIQLLGFQPGPTNTGQKFSIKRNVLRFMGFLRKGINYFLNLDGLVIFGGYPYKFRENDGYFQRVKAIDKILKDKQRVYIDNVFMPDRSFWYDRPENNVLVLNIFGKKSTKFKALLLMMLCIIRTRTIYSHSILPLRRLKLLFHIPFIKKIIDLHGAVPEEFLYHGDQDNSILYGKIEELTIRKSDHVIVVSKAMMQHILSKYRTLSQDKFIVLPILQSDLIQSEILQHSKGKPIIIYAGGLQKWQQVPKMINSIKETYDTYNYKFFCPNPDEFRSLLPSQIRNLESIEIGTKTKAELIDEYHKSDYGLILREDIIVNEVACPTKLVEYLAMGILPIVDTEKIGDFVDLGMKYVTLDQLINKNLPDEKTWISMVDNNFSVFKSLHQQFQNGIEKLRSEIIKKKEIERYPTLQSNSDHKSEKPGIGLVVNSFDKGGLEQAVFNLYEGYLKHGFRAYIFCQTSNVGHFASKLHSPEHLVIFNNDEEKFLKLCLEKQINWLHYHYNTFLIDKVKKFGIKTIYSIQNIYTWLSDTEIQNRAKLINSADFVVAGSTFSKLYYCNRTNTPETEVEVIPIGVNTSDLNNTELNPLYSRNSLGILEDEIVLGFIASFHEVKHQMNMVGAMEKIIVLNPKVKLIFLGNIGHEEYFRKVKTAWEKSPARENIIHLPFIDHSQLGEFLRQVIDIFILPTLQEGCSNAVIDALYCGIPMLLTDVGNASDLQHLESVTVVDRAYEDLYSFRQSDISKICLEKESRNNNQIVQGIIKIISNIDEKKEAAKIAAREYTEQCDKSMMVQNYVDLIKSKDSVKNKGT
jgi:GT2 family glycosyltransferase/glycosyltransferase involved in cell wall biosynthesis